jgi:hypothetical protein
MKSDRYTEEERARDRFERAEILVVVDDLAVMEDADGETFLARISPCLNGGWVGPGGRRFFERR